jgi:hypothetical protein
MYKLISFLVMMMMMKVEHVLKMDLTLSVEIVIVEFQAKLVTVMYLYALLATHCCNLNLQN